MAKRKTVRGQWIDVDAIMAKNQNVVALGNASMNARGDIVNKDGQIIQSRDEIAQEYYKGNPNAVKQVSIKDTLPENFFQTPKEVVNAVKAEKLAKMEEQETKKRKIIETDE